MILNQSIKVLLLALIIVSSLSILSLFRIFTADNFHTVIAQAKVYTTTSLTYIHPNLRPLYGVSDAVDKNYRLDPIADKNSTTNASQIITLPRLHLVPIVPYFMFPPQEEIRHPLTQQQAQQRLIQVLMLKGTINSLIKTPSAEWIATGNWTINLNNVNTTYFKTDMTWFNNNGRTSHSHEFQNFRSAATSTTGGNMTAIVQSGNNVILDGVMDVGTNHRIVWKNVPTTININGGKTITISVADNATNHHFAGQPIFGLVSSFTRLLK